jgi:hypothetical protein
VYVWGGIWWESLVHSECSGETKCSKDVYIFTGL